MKNKKIDWEKEFDSKFKDEKFGPSNYTHYFEESRIYKLIKDFISSLLQKQRTELLEEIKKEIDKETLISGIAKSNFLGRNWINIEGLKHFIDLL